MFRKISNKQIWKNKLFKHNLEEKISTEKWREITTKNSLHGKSQKSNFRPNFEEIFPKKYELKYYQDVL